MMFQATAIQLPFWQDPQGPLAVAIFESTCQVFFALWDLDRNQISDCLGKVTFSKCWATRTVGTEYSHYCPTPHGFHSYLLEVEESAWLTEQSQNRLETYPNWLNWDKTTYHHYVVEGAGSYVEVIAAGFAAEMASAQECRHYAFLLD